MKTVTLEAIETQHNKVAELIAQFKTQATTQFVFPETEIQLAHGEHYAGVIIGKNGDKSHHTILIEHEIEKINWQDAVEWAKSVGGVLPTRREQSLLFANSKEQFKEAWYWSGDQSASISVYAWSQYFDDGYQSGSIKTYECRARAVRRLVIE